MLVNIDHRSSSPPRAPLQGRECQFPTQIPSSPPTIRSVERSSLARPKHLSHHPLTYQRMLFRDSEMSVLGELGMPTSSNEPTGVVEPLQLFCVSKEPLPLR